MTEILYLNSFRVFLRMPTTSAALLFQHLSFMSADERRPISCYDYSHMIGFACQISARGWQLAHAPDAFDFSLSHFLEGVKCAFNKKECDKDEEVKLIVELAHFMLATENFRSARHHAIPADFSLEPIHHHMATTGYYSSPAYAADRGGFTPAEFCTMGYEDCVKANAGRFRAHQPCMDLKEVADTFNAVSLSLKAATAAGRSSNNQSHGKGQKKSGDTRKDGVCRYFNTKDGCRHDGDSCKRFGTTYKHICNFKVNGKLCGGSHSAYDEHKEDKDKKKD